MKTDDNERMNAKMEEQSNEQVQLFRYSGSMMTQD